MVLDLLNGVHKKVTSMSIVNRVLTYFKARLKLLGRWRYLILVTCLMTATVVVAQPFLTNAAGTSTNDPLVGDVSSKVFIPSGKKVDSTLPNSTSQQSSDKPMYIAGNWQSWEGDKAWFMQNFCTGGNQQWCHTNQEQSAYSNPRSGSNMKITGMAAGFDTTARIIINEQKCGVFKCSWKTPVDEFIDPRQYKTWTFSDYRKRTAQIYPTRGESRVHIAMTYTTNDNSSNSNSGQPPLQRYLFCTGSLSTPYGTEVVYANSYDDAERALRNRLGTLGAGDGWNIGRRACPL